VYSIFDQYLTHFGGKIPKIVADKILYSQIEIKKYWNPSNNHHNDILFSSKKNNLKFVLYKIEIKINNTF